MLINVRNSSTTFSTRHRMIGLGVAPAVVGATVAGTAAIAALVALVQNSMDDDWSAATVFETNMRKIHSAMLTLQCIVGGAQVDKPFVDTFGNKVCEGGTKPACSLSTGQLKSWRTLRDGFGMFWSDVQSFGRFGPSDSEAKQAKQFARDFSTFYNSIKVTCAKQGAALIDLPAPPPKEDPNAGPAWMKYAVWGIGGIAIIALAVSAKSIFGKG